MICLPFSYFAEHRHTGPDTKDSLAHCVFGKMPGKLRIDFREVHSFAMIQGRFVRGRSIFMPVRSVRVEMMSHYIIASISENSYRERFKGETILFVKGFYLLDGHGTQS